MRVFHPGSELARSMGMTPPTLTAHVERGTVTAPDAQIVRASSTEFAWEATSREPALDALGFAALVPAAEDLAQADLRMRSEYICPARSRNHLGRYDNITYLGFVHRGSIDFYRVAAIVRIGYLDSVRLRNGVEGWKVSAGTESRLIGGSNLNSRDKQILTTSVQARSAYHRKVAGDFTANEAVNPLEIAVYKVDPKPIVTDVKANSTVRSFQLSTDEISATTATVTQASLDDLAEAFKSTK